MLFSSGHLNIPNIFFLWLFLSCFFRTQALWLHNKFRKTNVTRIWHRNATRNNTCAICFLVFSHYIKKIKVDWEMKVIGLCFLRFGHVLVPADKVKLQISNVTKTTNKDEKWKTLRWTWSYLCRKNVNSWSSYSFIQENVPAIVTG